MGGYCENTFYPPKDKLPSADYGVVFIGTPLDGRAGALGELLGRLGTPVDIFGTRWKRTKLYPKWKKLLHPPVATDTYRETLWRAQIALGFVSSSNLDEFTLRSFEIPASGTFFLAERTPTHQQLYVEGREAEFFNGIEECRDKIAYYLQHDEQRRKIAQAGRRRCLESGYGNERRLQQALEQVWQS
jgi:spore maturation protein CgeB